MLDIPSLMLKLSRARPIFHVEADFQHAFAWQIHEAMPDGSVRLEFKPFPDDNKRMYLDIWLPSVGIAIELKYHTQGLGVTHDNERFSLAEHGAQLPRRYDFLADVERLEYALDQYQPAKEGYAILLTNYPDHWPPRGIQTQLTPRFVYMRAAQLRADWLGQNAQGLEQPRGERRL